MYIRSIGSHQIGKPYNQVPNHQIYGRSPRENYCAAQHYTFRDPSVCGPSCPPAGTGSPRSAAEVYIEDAPKFRQLPCRTFISVGTCPYRERCVYLHDPRLMSKDAKTKTRKKNKEDIVQDSLFWPVLSYHEISQRLDSFRLPHVIQRYGVPIPQDDQYRRHDQAVYSMWMHFVTYCSLDNESEGDVVTCIPQSPRQPPDKVDSKALFLDEASQVNPFVRTSRLSVFKTMALSLSAGVPSSSRSLTLTPSKPKHGSASPQSVTALSTPPHHRVNETNLFSKCSLRYQEYEREQAHMRLEIESERERERMHQNELLHRHRASEQRSDYGMLGSSQLSHFRGYSSIDNGVRHVPAQFPMVRMGASNQVQRQGQGQGHGPSLDAEEDFTTGSFSGLSPHAGIYNPYSTQNFQDVDYNTSYECSPSVSLSASRHCGNSGDTSPTSVSNRLSPISAHERSSFRHIECGLLEFSGESENNYLSLSAPSQYDSVTHSLLPPSSCHSSFHTRDNSCHDRTDTRYSDLHMFLSESSMLDEGQDEMDGPAFSTYDFLDQNGEEGSSPYVPSCLFRPIS